MANLVAIRWSALGDVILCTPLLRWWKQQMPNAKVTFVTGEAQAELLKNDPHIDQLLVYRKTELLELRKAMAASAPALIADFQRNFKSRELTRGLPFPVRRLNKQNVKKWLMVNGPIPQKPCRHVVQRMAELFVGFPVNDDGGPVALYVPEQMPQLSEFIFKDFIALALGSAHPTKAISLEWAAEFVVKNPNQHFVLLGGAAEAEKGKTLEAMAPTRIRNACGKTSLLETAWLVKASQGVVSGDTAVMHMAAAFEKPLDLLWTNTVPAFGMEPWYGKQSKFPVRYHQVENLPCRPCSKLGHPNCPLGHFRCMKGIPAWNVQDKEFKGFSRPITIV